jgi:hypothetical protein
LIPARRSSTTLTDVLLRAGRAPVWSLFLVAALTTGCRHKTPYMIPNIAQAAPIDLEESPSLTAKISEPPPVVVEMPTPALPPAPPKRTARRTAPPKPTPPVQVASAEPEPAVAAIGALSTGGETTPQNQQEAKDLIAAIQRRLAELPKKTADQQREPVRQVRHFLDQAQQALRSGDAEGAKTLATKAKLLMDDITK